MSTSPFSANFFFAKSSQTSLKISSMFSSLSGCPPIEMTRPTTRIAGGTPTLRKRSEASSLTIAAKIEASSMGSSCEVLLFYSIPAVERAEKFLRERFEPLARGRRDFDQIGRFQLFPEGGGDLLRPGDVGLRRDDEDRSEEHTSELQSRFGISY